MFFIIIDWIGINALFRRRRRGQVKCLLYHCILDNPEGYRDTIATEEFDRHIAYLKSKYNFLTLKQNGVIEGYSRDRVNLLVTFDDGFLNNYEKAFPILQKHGVTAAFFVISDSIQSGRPPSFAHYNFPSPLPMMNVDHAKEMIKAGQCIGSHSTNHDDFSKLEKGVGREDALKSKAELKHLLSVPIENFAFPFGKFRPEQLKKVQLIYKNVFLTEHGFSKPQMGVFLRNEVENYYHLKAAASGSLDFFKYLKNQDYSRL